MSDTYEDTDTDDLQSILDQVQNDEGETLVDLSEAASFKPLPQGEGSGPEGFYLVEIIESKHGAGVKTEKGDPAWKVTVKVIDPNADRASKIKRTMPLRGSGAGFARDFTAAAGFPLDAESPRLKAAHNYVGIKLWANLEPDNRKPEEFNQVGKVKAFGEEDSFLDAIGDD